MRIEVKLAADCPETCVVIHARQMDQEVKALLSKLEGGAGGLLVGFSGEEATVRSWKDHPHTVRSSWPFCLRGNHPR